MNKNSEDCNKSINWTPSLCNFLRKMLYLQDDLYDGLRVSLDDHKVARDDVPQYTTKMLQRQQLVNEKLVNRWIDDNNITDKVILDACCWPEWSSLAVLKRWGQWRWNEISKNTYEHLLKLGLNVKNWKAEKLDFSDKMFDYIIYCYAINNIQATPRVFQESLRVLNNQGKILIADPWISCRISDLILNDIKEYFSYDLSWFKEKLLKNKRFSEQIPLYFKNKGISNSDYVDVVLSWLCGINRDILLQELVIFLWKINDKSWNIIDPKLIKLDRLLHMFHQYINSIYRENIITTAKSYWMKLEKSWIFSCFQYKWNLDRWITENIWLDIGELSAYQLRIFFSELQKGKNPRIKLWDKWLNKLLPTILFKFTK